MRYLWAGLGCLSLLCGFIGVFLPLIPTVPFILLAAFLFARSSERMHNWLMSHPTFGPSIVDWQTHGAVSRRAKKSATLACAAVLLLSVFMGLRWQLIAIQAVTLSCVMIFLWTRPNGPS
ncbi:YbaN family protein [Pseudooceanicola sp. MF1-13]|uniref:YbaN family protein n=1 Tax=Pseudooceanicola sp. MF1-13 TaxID=3379095 RepID=UPI003892429B